MDLGPQVSVHIGLCCAAQIRGEHEARQGHLVAPRLVGDIRAVTHDGAMVAASLAGLRGIGILKDEEVTVSEQRRNVRRCAPTGRESRR